MLLLQVSASVSVSVVEVNDTTTEAVRGTNVLLDCIDSVPVVWSFNNIILLLDDRHTVVQNGSLLIREVDLIDMGDYSCEVGNVMIEHTLILTALPEISISPTGNCLNPGLLLVDSDMIVDVVCGGYGIPAPTVSWSFQGRMIVSSFSMYISIY